MMWNNWIQVKTCQYIRWHNIWYLDTGSITIESTGKPIYYDDYTLITKIFKNAYFHIFGELFIDEKYDPQEPDECKQTLSRPGPGVTCPDYVRPIWNGPFRSIQIIEYGPYHMENMLCVQRFQKYISGCDGNCDAFTLHGCNYLNISQCLDCNVFWRTGFHIYNL